MAMDKSELRRMFSTQPDRFYNATVLKEAGFERKKCKKCGGWFWSLGKETCGDTPCEGGYHFIGGRDLGWDLITTIEKWERFFERHRHRVIEPYPIVARWRDDLYFVIASIADFQPWVLRGVAEPPGNPLVVSQPCLRFNDLDNVGRTGRHLSMFFMGGQHAFNLHDYWINETLHFGFKFLTDVLKIPPEKITYKEDVWSGGGNFGPSMEAFADGMEIVNHVFMQFEETEGGYREMSTRVVDTGWGLERIAWFASKKANIYEAIFPSIAKLRHDLGISVDFNDPLWSKIGLYDVSEGAPMPADIRKKMEEMKPLQELYTILDHTRGLAFALAGGAIPSNVGGGYNLRVLLRRVFSIIEKNKFDLSPSRLIKTHARYFSRRFKSLKNLPDIPDIVEVEFERYKESKKRGKDLLVKYLKKGILQKKLVELYESHGVPPEMAVEIAREHGKKLKVPEDFYSKAEVKKKVKKLKGGRELPESKELFYDRPPEEPFEAKVLWSSENEVVLDETSFYPTGGGQVHDTGVLEWKGEEAKVKDVCREGKAIVHLLDRKAPPTGTRVKGRVDAERRRDIMRHHTAVHLINGAATKVLGNHVWQAGSEKTQKKARLDITHYKPVTEEEVRRIEKLANEAVLKNLKVRKMVLPRTAAEQRFGFRIYQGGAIPGAKLRTIEVPGYDTEACGGTHCDYTGEIGMIRITDTKRIQDGVVRIELVAGMRSLERFWKSEKLLREAAEVAGTKPEDLTKSVEKLKRRIKRLQRGGDVELKGKKVKWAVVDMPFRQMENLAKKKLKEAEAVVMVSREGGVCVVSGGKVSAVRLAKKISKKLGADAGGNEKVARGGARNVKNAEKVLREICERP